MVQGGAGRIGRRNSLDHMAPLGLTGERCISHQTTRFGKDSNPGRLDRSRLNINYATQALYNEEEWNK
ncbi:hypothetical protein E2C01_054603 [Portunus trituberculatus]|uniref:Uncharacterized protein n=1 Tax=Portunus trituberculatus TaxID=210409 RepID=A0A5B7GVG4_PORTR|nr:hypothetical protein [Portunus trituberculatus]